MSGGRPQSGQCARADVMIAIEVADVVGAPRLEGRMHDIMKDPNPEYAEGSRAPNASTSPFCAITTGISWPERRFSSTAKTGRGRSNKTAMHGPAPTANVALRHGGQTDANRQGGSPPPATPRSSPWIAQISVANDSPALPANERQNVVDGGQLATNQATIGSGGWVQPPLPRNSCCEFESRRGHQLASVSAHRAMHPVAVEKPSYDPRSLDPG